MGSRAFFLDIADALAGFLPRDLRSFSRQVTSANVKVWYDSWREHYEVQVVSQHALPRSLRSGGPVLEIGFHAEHPDAARSTSVVDGLLATEHTWRRALGPDAEAGTFLGSDRWARISELWRGEDVVRGPAAIEAAERLADYIRALEAVRRSLRTVATG